jgi:hypothetical protein
MSEPALKIVETDTKLDLGCGKHKTEGFIGVDSRHDSNADEIRDLTQYPWPWTGNSISEIVSNYYLSYLDGLERIAFMNECWRILKPQGKLVIKAAHESCLRAVADPLYKWPPICETSFLVFNKEWRKQNEQEHYPISCDFDYGYGFALIPEVAARNDAFQQMAVKHYRNAILDIIVTLTKRP